jgi:hypothetical protein
LSARDEGLVIISKLIMYFILLGMAASAARIQQRPYRVRQLQRPAIKK